MSFLIPVVVCDFPMSLLALTARLVAIIIRSHSAGKMRLIPNNTIIAPETNDQTDDGTPNRSVVDLRSRVKIMTDRTRLRVMMSGCFNETLALLLSKSDPPPTTTGNSGRMHGASMVRIPATNEKIVRSIKAAAPSGRYGTRVRRRRHNWQLCCHPRQL